MTKIQSILLVIGEVFFIALFFYTLYIIGGIAQGIKDLAKKINKIERKLKIK